MAISKEKEVMIILNGTSASVNISLFRNHLNKPFHVTSISKEVMIILNDTTASLNINLF